MKEAVRKFKETVEIKGSFFQRLRSHRYFMLITIGGGVLLVACFHVWQRVRVIELVKEVSTLRAVHNELVDDIKKVNSEISTLSLASRIETYAIDTLGMKPVKAEKLYTLESDGQQDVSRDELSIMKSAIKRVAEYIPVISESEVKAEDLQKIKIEDDSEGGVAE